MTFVGKKRISADDLLKRLEEPASKRRKKGPAVGLDAGLDSDSDFDILQKGKLDDGDITEDESAYGSENDSISSGENILQRSAVPASLALPTRIAVRAEYENASSKNVNTLLATSNFSSMNVSRKLVSSLAAMSITVPTEVQAACIPPLLQGKH